MNERTEVRMPWLHLSGGGEYLPHTVACDKWQAVDARVDNYIPMNNIYRIEKHQDTGTVFIFCTNGDIWRPVSYTTKCI